MFPNPIISLSNIYLKRENVLKLKIDKLTKKRTRKRSGKGPKVNHNEGRNMHSLKVTIGEKNKKKMSRDTYQFQMREEMFSTNT